MIANTLLYLTFALLLYASYIDVAQLRIPNPVVVAVAGLFVPFAVAMHMAPEDFLWHLAAGSAMLALGFVLFTVGLRFGGGDAKLFAALALWCGFANLLPLFVMMCFIGGGVAILFLLLRRFGIPIWLAANGYHIPALQADGGKPVIPYAPAMALSFISLAIFPAS